MSQITLLPQGLDIAPSFHFLDDSHVRPMSTKEKEIERSKARSHAAQIAHKKRWVWKHTIVPPQSFNVVGRPPMSHDVPSTFNNHSLAGTSHALYGQLQPQYQRPSRLNRQIPISNLQPTQPYWESRIASVDTSGSTSHTDYPSYCTREESCDCHRSCKASDQCVPSKKGMIVAPTPSPAPGFGCFRDEQFAGIPGASRPDVRDLVDFQFQIVSPPHDVFTELFDLTNVYAFFSPMLQFPLFYYAGLALVGLVRGRINTVSTFQTIADTLDYRGHAMQTIRRCLGRPGWQKMKQHQGLVSAIIVLACFEYASGRMENGHQHMQALEKIIADPGFTEGSAIIESCTEQMRVNFYGSTFAMAGWLDPKQYSRPWQPSYPSFPIESQLQMLLDKVPPGFYNLAMEGKICSDTIEILARGVDIEIERLDGAKQRARASWNRHIRTYDNVFKACPILHATETTQAILIDKMICLAMMVFCCSGAHVVMSTTICFRPSKAKLDARLRNFQPQTNAERECLVWLFIVSLNVHRPITNTGTMLTDEGIDLLRCLYEKFPELLRRKEWSDIERILRRFFWPPELSPSWRWCWPDLVSLVEKP